MKRLLLGLLLAASGAAHAGIGHQGRLHRLGQQRARPRIDVEMTPRESERGDERAHEHEPDRSGAGEIAAEHVGVVARRRPRADRRARELAGDGCAARAVGLHDRGVLGVGMKADINVIDMDRLTLHLPDIVHDLRFGR